MTESAAETPRPVVDRDPLQEPARHLRHSPAADVRALLAQTADLTSAEVVDRLLADQVRRWQHGERVPVEAYLQLHPALASDSADAFELVYNEFLLREHFGEAPTPAEFIWRFPGFAQQLQRQLDLHRAFVADDHRPHPDPAGAADASLSRQPQAGEAATEPGTWPEVAGYEILGELGRGGMGVVYKARQTELQRLVAFKMILDGSFAAPDQVARFRREAEAIARLQHPNIVQIHEIGTQAGRPFFSMELVDGGSLAHTLAATPQNPRAAAELMQTLARAVHAAHKQGVVHRDLKPANVLLTRDGIPKITDFGLAKIGDRAPSTGVTRETVVLSSRTPNPSAPNPAELTPGSGAILGSPSYMAPEQARGKSQEVGPAADVYALGAILYELLTGRPPFKGETPFDTVLQVLHEEPVPPRRLQPKLPRDLETICLKCLHKEAARRYARAEDLAEDLRRFLAGEPILARPITVGERSLKWAKRRPALAALVAGGIVAALALLGVVLAYNARLQVEVRRAENKEAEAKASYREARASIKQMLSRLDEKAAAAVPGLKDLHRRLLEDALRFYQRFLKDRDNPDPEVRFDTAQAYVQTAWIQNLLGRSPREALEHFQCALDMYRDLAAEDPSQTEYQDQRIDCWNKRGEIHRWLREPQEAEQCHRDALALCGELIQKYPEDARWQRHLAQTHHCLAKLYHTRAQGASAEEHFLEAMRLGEDLVKAGRASRDDQMELATVYTHIGQGYSYSKPVRVREAEAVFRKAKDILEVLGDPRQNINDAIRLGQLCATWGILLHHVNRNEEALPLFARGLEILEPFWQREPDYSPVRATLVQCHGGLAAALWPQKRYAEIILHWDWVVKLETEANRDYRRSELAVVLARIGDYARGAAEAKTLGEQAGVKSDTLFNAACTYSLCIPAVRQDTKLPKTEQDQLAESYAVAAMDLLRKARAAGLCQNLDQLKALETDKDLDQLRSRADFQKFMDEVKAPTKTAGP